MSKIQSAKELLETYRQQSARLLPEPIYKKMVPEEEQMAELEHLKETIQYGRFFFVVNLHTMELQHQHGIERWLGYKDKDFDFYTYLKLIHPAHVAAHNITSTTLIEGLMSGDWNIEFMKHRYITSAALQHKDGHYLLCKRLACIFQYNDKNQLLEYINEFTVVGAYNGEPFSVRATNDQGEELQWLQDFLERTQRIFQEKNLFSFQELRILRKYAYHDQLSVADIAKAFKIQESSVITYHKRILEKANHLFSNKFSNAKQVAIVLKQQGLL